MLDREFVAAQVAARLPGVWRRAAGIDGLQERIVAVLADPRNGDLGTQLDTLCALFAPAASLDEQQWAAWASYAFGGQQHANPAQAAAP